MKKVQISFDEKLLETVDRVVVSSQMSRSAIVREALKNWLRQRQIKEFEDEWIAKLRESPQDSEEAEAWLSAESWTMNEPQPNRAD
jgi:metal-responsive CopG/Arc/MetJ family transcriptional regulator